MASLTDTLSREMKINESKSSTEISLGLLDTPLILVRGKILFWHSQTETWENRSVTKIVFSLKAICFVLEGENIQKATLFFAGQRSAL